MIYAHEWLERHGLKNVTEDEWRDLDKLSAAAEFAEADWERAEAKRQQAKASGDASRYELATTSALAAASRRDSAREAMLAAGNALADKQKQRRKEAEADVIAEAVARRIQQPGVQHRAARRVRGPKVTSRAAESIASAWAKYRNECSGIRQPTHDDFLDRHGNDPLYTGMDGLPICANDIVKNADGLRKVLNRCRMNADNAAKRGNAKPTQKRVQK